MDIKLKHILKKSILLTRAGYMYREKITTIRIQKNNCLPTKSKKILFATTEGRFNDSCRPIAEYLHRTAPDVELVWAIREKRFANELPDYLRYVEFESADYYRELATSSVWVFNYLIPQGTIKRENQLYIQVWHGDKPFKRIVNEAATGSKRYRKRTAGRKLSEDRLCDWFMTGSDLFTDIWRRSVDYHGKVLNTGLPRNDILLKHPQNTTDIRNKLGITEGVMVLTYAPTFRDHRVDNGSIGTDLDLNQVLDYLEERYSKPWICLMRAHGGKDISLENTKEEKRIIDVTQYCDMTDLLLISDMLLTDYSSCAGDFAFTGRPVILYQDDYESYTTKDRALVFDIKESPFFCAHSLRELKALIDSLSVEAVQENDRQILEFYRTTQTDHSTEDISRIILDHIRTCELSDYTRKK